MAGGSDKRRARDCRGRLRQGDAPLSRILRRHHRQQEHPRRLPPCLPSLLRLVRSARGYRRAGRYRADACRGLYPGAGKDFEKPTATGITAYLEASGTLENAQAMAAHESPRTTKLYDRTGDEITLDEVERITI